MESRPPRATLTVALLCLLNVAAFIDAMILALLMAPIKAELGVSDTQLGLLFGLGFALCYIVVSVPLAQIADRGNRKRLLLCGVTLWTVMTFASAFAWNFASLFIARAGIAVGEAVLVPIAISMIADLYPANRRTMPTSILLTVRAVMSQGALVAGGGVVALAHTLSGALGLASWRLSFMIAALPPILLALCFAGFVPEPTRGDRDCSAVKSDTFVAAARHLFAHAGVYLSVFLGISCLCATTIIMIAWIPTMLIREHGLTAAQAGLTYGLPALAGAIAGTLSVPALLKRLKARTPVGGLLIVAVIGLSLTPMAPLLIPAACLPLVMVGIAITTAGSLGCSVLPPLLVQAITPPQFRARLVALYLTILTILGQGLGPSLVTTLAAHGTASPLSGSIARAIWLMLGLATIFIAVAVVSTRRAPTDQARSDSRHA